MRRVLEHVSTWMRSAGLDVRLDPASNVIGRRSSSQAGAPALVIGSHLDTVPNAGKYDGVLGVLLGVAAVQALGCRRLPFAVEVVGFSEEEGVRYRSPYIGSSALSGRFDKALLDRRDERGIAMADAFRAFGLDPDNVAQATYRPGSILAYFEAHIEQGPVLDACDLPLGIVEAIAGQSRLRVAFEGHAGHAGTSPMTLRRDALPAAAELILEVEQQARCVPELRATVGSIAVEPGATNVIPGVATLSLDIRHAEDEVRSKALAGLLDRAGEIAVRRQLTFRVVEAEHHNAVPADSQLTGMLASAVADAGLEARRMVSGAGHDGAIVAAIAPMAMLFLRSPGGASHHPDEAVHLGDVRTALDVILRFIDKLATSRLPAGER
jgi:allantoate deiminase